MNDDSNDFMSELRWEAVEPRSRRKAPWASMPGVIYEGTILLREGDPPITRGVSHCGHRHINSGPARKCSEVLARKLNKAGLMGEHVVNEDEGDPELEAWFKSLHAS